MTPCNQLLLLVLSLALRPAHPDVVARFDERQCAGPRRQVDFRLYVPPSSQVPEGGSAKKKPLVIWFHGGGESGTDNRDQLAWLELVFGTGSSQHDPAAFVLAMQFPPEAAPAQPAAAVDAFAQLDAALHDVSGRYAIDRDRIYLAGISLGANRAWQYACRHPGRFAGLLSMAAGPIVERDVCNLENLPVWAFQSTHDGPKRVAQLQRVIRAVCALEKSATITIVNSATHDCWTTALKQYHAWRWLLDQRRGGGVRRFGQSFAGRYLSRSQAMAAGAAASVGLVWLATAQGYRLAKAGYYRFRCAFQRARDDAG